MAVNYQGSIEGSEARERSWSFQNDCLIYWKRPVSGHEEAKIECAATQVDIIVTNLWRSHKTVTLVSEDSEYYNANARLEAGMDLRIQHPAIRVTYSKDTDSLSANFDPGTPIRAARTSGTACLFRARQALSLANAPTFAKATLAGLEV
jgi:hypothetical protein